MFSEKRFVLLSLYDNYPSDTGHVQRYFPGKSILNIFEDQRQLC
ncbi:MAG TPA: hypothetical protein P5104_07650 [Bacteroidales bacterium]|nr:hypothetical protein [Bacteroidales bacterium]